MPRCPSWVNPLQTSSSFSVASGSERVAPPTVQHLQEELQVKIYKILSNCSVFPPALRKEEWDRDSCVRGVRVLSDYGVSRSRVCDGWGFVLAGNGGATSWRWSLLLLMIPGNTLPRCFALRMRAARSGLLAVPWDL